MEHHMSGEHPWNSKRWQVYTIQWDMDGTRRASTFKKPWAARRGIMADQRDPAQYRRFKTFEQAIDWATRKARAELGPPNPPGPPTWARPVG
jgi:hypothetical protein